MKKLVLGMVFVLLTAFFIGFNYLLWERENNINKLKSLENQNASNSASINAYKREIESLEKKNDTLEEELKKVKDDLNRSILEAQILTDEKNAINKTLQERITYINGIKQHIDLKILSEPLMKWAEAINQGKYDEAYELEFEGTMEQDRTLSREEYTELMKNNVRKIEITDVKLDKFRGSGNGDIYLEVRMNVKLTEEANTKRISYIDGINDRYVKLAYSYDQKAFIISSINNN